MRRSPVLRNFYDGIFYGLALQRTVRQLGKKHTPCLGGRFPVGELGFQRRAHYASLIRKASKRRGKPQRHR
jgi:hypothetical protein